jgi:hypothetical protein
VSVRLKSRARARKSGGPSTILRVQSVARGAGLGLESSPRNWLTCERISSRTCGPGLRGESVARAMPPGASASGPGSAEGACGSEAGSGRAAASTLTSASVSALDADGGRVSPDAPLASGGGPRRAVSLPATSVPVSLSGPCVLPGGAGASPWGPGLSTARCGVAARPARLLSRRWSLSETATSAVTDRRKSASDPPRTT